uniref:Uncharacterized protein n=1 Tax=Dermapteran orthomyxo-related virus OKIAV170 TaxID=2746276 RepID=A0A7D7IV74_9ORTO|nr:hypothetical protein [Dermapteran orthomyxo-related virus OKIAV170]
MPTDKINIITIEKTDKNKSSKTLIRCLPHSLVYESSNSYLVIRNNSVMKEDTAYKTFSLNTMFCPINTIGMLLLEDPKAPLNMDPLVSYTKSIEPKMKWFVERFVENVLMLLIGNSRDEGYFPFLRKFFMILLQLRRNKSAASWDMHSFVTKMNDCILDNPISMHFQCNLIDVLYEYV